MRMRQIVLICGLGAALMAGMAQAVERHDGYQSAQVESQSLSVMPCDLAQTVTAVAAEEYDGFAPMVATKTAVGFGEGASNTERMRQSIGGEEIKLTVSSVTSPAKAPEDPGKTFS